jgi:hypothetical protein
MTSRSKIVLAAALAALAAGCRGEMPKLDGDPEVQEVRAKARPGAAAVKLAMAPVEVAYKPTSDLEKDSSRYPAKVDREEIRTGLAAAIGANTSFAAPRPLAAADLAAGFAEAQEAGRDVLVRPVLTRLDCAFRGRNWRWVPNLALFLYAWVPSFWVPDEDYALEGELALEFYSVASERLLYRKPIAIDAPWPLDDFERGWSWTGIITAPKTVDPDDWAIVARSLAPLAEFQAEKGTAIECAEKLEPYLRGDDYAAKDATVFALLAGVSRHAGGRAGAASAAVDAEKLGTFLVERAHVPAKNVRVLKDEQASLAAVERAFAEVLGRSRAGDTVLIYWSGHGSWEGADGAALTASDAPADPERYLLPFDADPRALGKTGLSLKHLRELVARVPARRAVVVLDASFGAGRPESRTLAREGEPAPRTDAALERWTERRDGKDLALLAASSPGEDAIDLEGAGRGLLSFLFEEGASGAADEDRDGAVSLGELEGYLEREVASQAGLGGTPQHPRLYRQGHRVAPLDPAGKVPWLPNADVTLKKAGG